MPSTPRWESFVTKPRSRLRRYVVPVALSVVGVLCVALVQSDGRFLAVTFTFELVLFASFYGGFGPGICSALVVAFGVDYFAIEPVGKVLNSFKEVLFSLIVVLNSILISLVVSSLHTAYEKSSHARKEAERATQIRETTLAIVAHDLKNPLSTISLNFQLIKEMIIQGCKMDRLDRQMGVIDQSVRQIGVIIQDLLDAARISEGLLPIQPREIDLNQVGRDLVASFEAQAMIGKRSLHLHLKEPEVWVNGDRVRIVQALSNLISNAIKFSPVGGAIHVRIESDEATARVFVKDSGPGIKREDIPTLFERFGQVKTAVHMGTGLGLFIAKGIVEAHHGRIGVNSQPGKGAEFFVTLPKRSLLERDSRRKAA